MKTQLPFKSIHSAYSLLVTTLSLSNQLPSISWARQDVEACRWPIAHSGSMAVNMWFKSYLLQKGLPVLYSWKCSKAEPGCYPVQIQANPSMPWPPQASSAGGPQEPPGKAGADHHHILHRENPSGRGEQESLLHEAAHWVGEGISLGRLDLGHEIRPGAWTYREGDTHIIF